MALTHRLAGCMSRTGGSLALLLLVMGSTGHANAQGYAIQDLGTLGGRDSWATALNGAGQVVGYAHTARGLQHAFLWRHGQLLDLGTQVGAERLR
jgi:probable HAF family extracellular repeat protein